jgi:hypothetical protein
MCASFAKETESLAPMVASSKVRMKPNTGIFRMLANTPPTKEPAMPQDIGENAMIGIGYLFGDPSGDRPDHQQFQKANTRITEKSLRIFHRTLLCSAIALAG